MRFHRIVVLPRRRIDRVDRDVGPGELGVEVTARRVGREVGVDLLGGVQPRVIGAKRYVRRLLRVIDMHETGRLDRCLETRRYDGGDDLTAIRDGARLEEA